MVAIATALTGLYSMWDGASRLDFPFNIFSVIGVMLFMIYLVIYEKRKKVFVNLRKMKHNREVLIVCVVVMVAVFILYVLLRFSPSEAISGMFKFIQSVIGVGFFMLMVFVLVSAYRLFTYIKRFEIILPSSHFEISSGENRFVVRLNNGLDEAVVGKLTLEFPDLVDVSEEWTSVDREMGEGAFLDDETATPALMAGRKAEKNVGLKAGEQLGISYWLSPARSGKKIDSQVGVVKVCLSTGFHEYTEKVEVRT